MSKKQRTTRVSLNPLDHVTAARVRAQRAFLHAEQTEFAPMLDISVSHLSRLENGRVPVSKKLAKRFVDRFGVGIPIEYEPLTAPPCPVCHTEPAGLERLTTQKHETKIGYKCRTCGYAYTVTAV